MRVHGTFFERAVVTASTICRSLRARATAARSGDGRSAARHRVDRSSAMTLLVGVALSSRPWRGVLQRHCRDHVADVVVALLHDGEEAIARLDRADIANASMNTMADFIAHPQHAERDRWRRADSP